MIRQWAARVAFRIVLAVTIGYLFAQTVLGLRSLLGIGS